MVVTFPLEKGTRGDSAVSSGRARDQGRRPTIPDVAERAGVSKSVVSRALRGEERVSPLRRQAVIAAAADVDYRPNAMARSLVQRRTYNVGVVVSDLHNTFFAEVLDGVNLAIRWVSPGESHPQATLRTRRERLRSPGSQHSARRGIGELSRLISRGDWPNDHARVLRPLGSARITEHHRYYGAIRPCAPPRSSAPYVLALSGFSL